MSSTSLLVRKGYRFKGPVTAEVSHASVAKVAGCARSLVYRYFPRQEIKADQNVIKAGRDPQSAYTAVINQMTADGSNHSLTTMATSNAIELRSEAQLQGLTSPDIVWMCTTCNDSSLEEHADVMNDSLMRLSFLPFEEASTNPTLANFVEYVRKDKADSSSERVLYDRPVREPQVRSRLPLEEGNVRLQGVERGEDQSRPDRLTRT
jgi:hypothetical protein